MKTIFVSSQRIDRPPANELVSALAAMGATVKHSPRNPLDGGDSQWLTWYETGLPQAVGQSSAFVIVLDQAWDSSTWMGIEAQAAVESSAAAGPLPMFFWNPMGLEVEARGMKSYLKRRLPDAIADAVKQLVADGAA